MTKLLWKTRVEGNRRGGKSWKWWEYQVKEDMHMNGLKSKVHLIN